MNAVEIKDSIFALAGQPFEAAGRLEILFDLRTKALVAETETAHRANPPRGH